MASARGSVQVNPYSGDVRNEMTPPSGSGNAGSSGSQPPRWSWWVVGIVIPVMGILVSVLLGTRSSSSSPEVAPSQSKPPTISRTSASPEPGSGTAPKVRFGPDDVKVTGDSYVDLDSVPPLIVSTETRGADIYLSFFLGNPSLSTSDDAMTLAPLPAAGSAPSEEECAAQVQNNGTYTAELTRGARFCVQTAEGRTAYIRVVTAVGVASGPLGGGMARLKVTVWELPA
jgi:hypothetical protein